MKKRRIVVVAAVAALMLTVVLIGAVAAKVASSLTTQQGTITNLHMSDSCEGDEVILFPAGTETAYLVFDYFDMQGQEMKIKVTGPQFSVEAEHPSVIKSSGWITETGSEGKYVEACGSVSPNATLTSTFRADAISMTYVKDTDGGVAEVQVDSRTPITVDMCAGDTTMADTVIASDLGPELHTITVKVLPQTSSCGGSCVRVDRFWNDVVLYDLADSYTEDGTECIELTYSGGAIPPGNYAAIIYSGENLPIKSKLWHVQADTPGQFEELHMSDSPDGQAMTEFPPGTQTVYAVFDYADMPEDTEIGICVRMVKELETGCIVEKSESFSGSGEGSLLLSLPHLGEAFSAGPYRSLMSKGGYVDQWTDWRVNYGIYLPLTCKNQP